VKYLIILSVSIILCCSSQGGLSEPDETYPVQVNVRIYGDDSLNFSGEYGNNTDTSIVTGIVPVGAANYVSYNSTIIGASDSAFAKFRKEQSEGQLKVTIYVEDHLKTWKATSNSFDSVYVSWKP